MKRVPKPTADNLLKARTAAGLNQQQAAEVIGLKLYSRWSEYERGSREIDPLRWEWFLLQTDQHPSKQLVNRGKE